MLKRCLLAVIVSLLVTSSQIAAADDIDWLRVKYISTKTELAHYIENSRQKGYNFLPVVLTGGLTVSIDEFIRLAPSSIVSQEIVHNDGQEIRVIYRLLDYPGTRVANAYLRGDISGLTNDEKQLYYKAVEIVNEANKRNTEMSKEYHIYEEIMQRTEYFTGNMDGQPRFVTAIGALVDGKANCQGYTDAFYMLGRMCGLNVGRMSGQAGGGDHAWNTITFNDGTTYCVDVTWGDDGFGDLYSYIYFNAPLEIMQVDHSWDQSLAPLIQGSIDDRYSYGSKIIGEGYDSARNARITVYNVGGDHSERTNDAEFGLKLLAQKIAENEKRWFTVMTPYDERYADYNQASEYFSNELLNNTNFYGSVMFDNVYPLGKKYLFFCAHYIDS